MQNASSFIFPVVLEPQLEALCQQITATPMASFSSSQTDPYWPKWDHLWWQLCFLLECDQIKRLPQAIIADFAGLIDQHYLHFFPLTESELPEGCDPYRQILCHCALGTAVQILQATELDPWQEWPWLKQWFLNYQLADGGYNCDENVYTHSCRSSVVSTLPMLEALLNQNKLNENELNENGLNQNALSPDLQAVLHQGMQSLLNRKLFQSSQAKTIDPLWLRPLFPRFYHYDILRAVKAVLRWQRQYPQPWPESQLAPALAHLSRHQHELGSQDWYPAGDSSLTYSAHSQEWHFGEKVSLFPLLSEWLNGGYSQAVLQAEYQALEPILKGFR